MSTILGTSVQVNLSISVLVGLSPMERSVIEDSCSGQLRGGWGRKIKVNNMKKVQVFAENHQEPLGFEDDLIRGVPKLTTFSSARSVGAEG